MKILITGSDGQLGSELVNQLEKNYDSADLIRATIYDFDIADYETTKSFIMEVNPDLIINCAAYTNVDDCEDNIELAYGVNTTGSKNIAISSIKCDASVVYISTDYIFDGSKNSPYNELDIPNPLNIYGKSKLKGEQVIKDHTDKFYIIRTSWLYGKTGNNFVKTVLKMAKSKPEIRIVNDQIGAPTDVNSLSMQIIKIIDRGKYGTYHASCNGFCSWYEFACEIVKLAGLDVLVIPIETKDYPLPAKRPKYSVLDNYNLRVENLDKMPIWKDSIEDFLNDNTLEVLM